ncbi:PREDICTED: uncharacterized protein LOC108364568 isoform X3 [Rhagoletis zephyria]|uniref:uncharacterized protein LOC108364568 isoform X3 n=1 Tax=Rhagoletis zephyria TaxID=28612 RepID=UPI0008113F43|nr:PREDICTED: uncharacterized protein LOC108364568 isoform X3 [Rhagoletis zephyria]
MSYRPLFGKLMETTKLRQLLTSQHPQLMRARLQHSIKPRTPLNNPSLFSPTIIKRYWETIPIVTFVLAGVTCGFLWTLRLALTRHDVCYFGKMPYEDYTRIRKNQLPPIMKFRTYNQKYRWPPGLVAAVKDGDF